MEIGVIALQGSFAEHAAALADAGASARLVRSPHDLLGIAAIVIPGGESTTLSMLMSSSGIFEPLAKEIAAGLPAMGTCAGMIMLAAGVRDGRQDQRSFGAMDITVRRNASGRQVDSFEAELEVPCLGDPPLHGVFIRAPAVESAGPEVEVLARLAVADTLSGTGDTGSRDGLGSPVLCRQGSVIASTFHPELTADRRLHRLFVAMAAASA